MPDFVPAACGMLCAAQKMISESLESEMMNAKTDSDLRYFGTDIVPCVGDHVRFIDDEADSIVEDVIETPEKKKEWGLAESGIMIKWATHGLVFVSENDPELEFVSRKQ